MVMSSTVLQFSLQIFGIMHNAKPDKLIYQIIRTFPFPPPSLDVHCMNNNKSGVGKTTPLFCCSR